MEDKCINCKHYIKEKKFNNCKKNIIGTVRENNSACYLIQFSKISIEDNK